MHPIALKMSNYRCHLKRKISSPLNYLLKKPWSASLVDTVMVARYLSNWWYSVGLKQFPLCSPFLTHRGAGQASVCCGAARCQCGSCTAPAAQGPWSTLYLWFMNVSHYSSKLVKGSRKNKESWDLSLVVTFYGGIFLELQKSSFFLVSWPLPLPLLVAGSLKKVRFFVRLP